jgi:hypothetical protein
MADLADTVASQRSLFAISSCLIDDNARVAEGRRRTGDRAEVSLQ